MNIQVRWSRRIRCELSDEVEVVVIRDLRSFQLIDHVVKDDLDTIGPFVPQECDFLQGIEVGEVVVHAEGVVCVPCLSLRQISNEGGGGCTAQVLCLAHSVFDGILEMRLSGLDS